MLSDKTLSGLIVEHLDALGEASPCRVEARLWCLALLTLGYQNFTEPLSNEISRALHVGLLHVANEIKRVATDV